MDHVKVHVVTILASTLRSDGALDDVELKAPRDTFLLSQKDPSLRRSMKIGVVEDAYAMDSFWEKVR